MIVDNVERIGKEAWEIIKIVQKLTSISGFIFLLPMNAYAINNVISRNDNVECQIEKYIDIPMYIFQQNYTCILENYGIKKNMQLS